MWIFRARVVAHVSAPPPEANTEYSRAPKGSKEASGIDWRRLARARRELDRAWSRGISSVVLGAALLGGLLLIIAVFTNLFTISTSPGGRTIKTVSTGSHDSYALVPIALLAVALAFGAAIRGSRPALLGVGALGVVTLLIALVGDLPDAQASGVIGSPGSGFLSAGASPSAGLYLETLGAILLLISSGCGLLLTSPVRVARNVSRT